MSYITIARGEVGGHAHRQVQSISGYSLKKKPWSDSNIDDVWVVGNWKKSKGMVALCAVTN